MTGLIIESQAVDWWSVHQLLQPLLEEVGTWPLAGSLTWVRLPDDHLAKWASVLDGGRHWALRVETAQQALADASRAISVGEDWPAVAREIRRRSGVYIPREVA